MHTLKPGDLALVIVGRTKPRARAGLVARIWRSVAGTERVELVGAGLRPGASFDRRQCLALEAPDIFQSRPADRDQHTDAGTTPAGCGA